MYQNAFRFITFLAIFVLAFGAYVPGKAAPQAGLTTAGIINIAHFYKPPTFDAATAVQNFNTIVLTNGDHVYREQLLASGFYSTIPEYFRSEAIYDPGGCTASTLNNTVAYNTGDFCWISQNHPDWFLLDQYGKRITVTSGGRYYRMDPGNAGWRDFFVTRVIQSQQQYGWTALFLDDVEGGLGKFYDTKPVKYPDNASYQAAVQGFLQYLYVNYSQNYGRPIYGNIVARADDEVWFNYLQYMDGAMQERFAVDWSETSYISANQWNKDMSMMEQTQANGKFVILVAPGYQADVNRETFAFASYLLISNGKAAFRYSTDDSYREVWLYDNYKVNLGTPLGPRYWTGSVWQRDFSHGRVTVNPANYTASISTSTGTSANVSLAGAPMGSYSLSIGQSQRIKYANANGGPLQVVSTTGMPILASLRDLWSDGSRWSSSVQLMGLPVSQLSDKYIFPSYNNVSLSDQLRFANVGASATTVTVTIGGVVRGTYPLNPNQSQRVSYAGLDGGPVIVQSSNKVSIIASIRDAWSDGSTTSSFAQLMGLPAHHLSDSYYFPTYNNVTLDDQIRFGNVGTSSTTVTVIIGSVTRGSYTLKPNESKRVNYAGVDSGPVIVRSSGKVPIIASIRDAWSDGSKTSSYVQLMGLPASQLSTTYFFPMYDNVNVNAQLRFGNVGNTQTTVTVTIAGVVRGIYILNPMQNFKVSYAGLNAGPVIVQSSTTPIIASVRDALWDGSRTSSYAQLMGLPASQLSTAYYFPAYNNVTYDNELRIAVP